jgi:hypothetical protein
VLLDLFFETRFAVYLSNMRWKEIPCNNTVRFLEFVLDLGIVKRPLVGMSGGINVWVRAACKLTMQTICDFQHIVSFKKKK